MDVVIILLLIMVAFASEQKENDSENLILVKIEEDQCPKVQKKFSNFIGVSYNEEKKNWGVSRWSKEKKKTVHNGGYKDEISAAHASDTLARQLMTNYEQNHALNFPDDDTEMYPEQSTSSNYIGVSYNKNCLKWRVIRCMGKSTFSNGYYKNEEKAAHASDTLARRLMENGKEKLKLNFPDDNTEVYTKATNKSSKFLGVYYNESQEKWTAQRRSKSESKTVYNGTYKDEKRAAHASDTLARKLLANGEQDHKLNFPEDETELQKKEKTSSNYFGVCYNKKKSRWNAYRYDKSEKKTLTYGSYKTEESAAHASDNLARQLIDNGEQVYRLNFPDDDTEVYAEVTKYNSSEHQKRKRKRSENEDLGFSNNK